MSDNNRIGSACWYKLVDAKTGYIVQADWRPGRLRAWSTDHEECDGNYGSFPVGVVEDDDTGMCHPIYVPRICFAAVRPTE